MLKQQNSFLHIPSFDISIDISQICKKEPILYSASVSSIDQTFQLELMKDKYQKQYNKFHKAQHKRSRSQMDKIDKIIQDANDLNQILNGSDKWLQKTLRKGERIELSQLSDDVKLNDTSSEQKSVHRQRNRRIKH